MPLAPDVAVEILDLRYDTSPLGTGKNWVSERGGLPSFVRAIAHALQRSGHSESGAIQLAIGAVKRWAAGGGNVHPSTRARAAAAVAHWEAMKASTGRSEGVVLVRDWATWDLAHPYIPHPRIKKKASSARPRRRRFAGSIFQPVRLLVDGKRGYVAAHPELGAPGNFDIDYSRVAADPVTGKRIAALYATAPVYDPSAQAAYDQLKKETAMQYEYLTKTLGVKVEVVPKDPYKNVGELVHDITVNHHQYTLSTAATGGKLVLPTGKPIFTNEENDQFRAVHDAFGHGASGRAFDRNGEAAAWTSHMQMYSPLAGRAVTTETHARNSVLIYGTPEQKTGPAFAAQKVFLLPDEYSDTSDVIRSSMAEQAAADADNLYDQTHCHHTSQGRYLPHGDVIHLRNGSGGAGMTESSSASLLLPVGPSKKQSAAVGSAEKSIGHRFEGTDLDHCDVCGKPVSAAVHHQLKATASGPGQPIAPVPRQAKLIRGSVIEVRHRGPVGHAPVHTGHVKANPTRHVKAAQAQNLAHIDAGIAPLTDAVKGVFASQRKETLARLSGKRGKQMLKRAASDPNQPPEIPPEDTGAQPPPPPSVDPAAIFTDTFWAQKMAEAMTPHLQATGTLAADAVKSQMKLSPMVDDSTSLGNLRAMIAQRANEAASYATGTTAKQLSGALQEGIAAGEGVPAIGKRINDIFDNADIVRAKSIAQTETVSAYNAAANAYAEGLPKDVVGSRRWLAHHDDRTRPTHRLADGQEQPMGQPFYVGGYPMMFPGDKAAPSNEWINCRCSVAYLPPNVSYGGIAAAAQAYVDGLKAKPPPPVSPYETAGVG